MTDINVYTTFYYTLRNLVLLEDKPDPEEWKSYIRGMTDMAEAIFQTLEYTNHKGEITNGKS